MKIAGLLVSLAGWGIVLLALVLLKWPALPVFVLSGFGVELLGVALLFRAHLAVHEGGR